MVKKIAYYITGHGLGHATRSAELIRGLLSTKEFHIYAVTTVPESYFNYELRNIEDMQEVFTLRTKNVDTGGVQLDAIRMDIKQTVVAYYDKVHSQRNAIIEQEVEWIHATGIDLILMDASIIGAAIGKQAKVPSVFVTNFTWDFVHNEMLKMLIQENTLSNEEIAKYSEMVLTAFEDTKSCDKMLQYPGATPMPTGFDESKIIPAPLIARPIKRTNMREILNIPQSSKVLVLGFGGHHIEWKLHDSFLPENWVCLVLRAPKELMPSERFIALDDNIHVPDIIHIADAVLGKIGYGFVSECITCKTPLIYVPRSDWPEEKYLEIVLTQQYDAGVKIRAEDFYSGSWATFLQLALEKKQVLSTKNIKEAENSINIVVETIRKLADDLTPTRC